MYFLVGLSFLVAVQAANSVLPSNIRVWGVPDELYIPGPPASGFLPKLLDAITEITGIPYTLTPHPELTFASPKGNFNGSIIEALLNNQADLIGPDITLTAAREAVVDFLVPYALYNIQLVANTQFGITSDTQYLAEDNADLALLQKSQNVTLKAIYDKIDKSRPASIIKDFNYTATLAKVASGNFAFVAESQYIATATRLNKLPKNVRVFDSNLGTYYLSLAVQAGSPLQEVLNRAIDELTERGTMRTLKNKFGVQLYTAN